jgi:Uncharacterised nucleotidyltransferase
VATPQTSRLAIDPAVAVLVGSIRRALGHPTKPPAPDAVAALAPRLSALASWHRLGGCLAADPCLAPSLPESTTAPARNRTIQLLLETSRVLDRLAQAGIPAIPLKGPLLSARLLGNPTFREAHDIDILVEWDRIDHTQAVLAPEYQPDARSRRPQAHREHHEHLKPVAGGRMVEVHWKLLQSQSGARIEAREPWDAAVWRTDAGIRHLSLDPAMEAVVIGAHTTHHFGFRLHWITDVASLMVKLEPAVWTRALEIADRWQVKRAMLTAIEAASLTLDLPIGPPLDSEVARHASHAGARWIAARLRQGVMEEPRQFSVWPRRLGLFDNPVQMVRTTLVFMFTPLPEDRAASGLPSWADPLTAVLRPFFVVRRAVIRLRS